MVQPGCSLVYLGFSQAVVCSLKSVLFRVRLQSGLLLIRLYCGLCVVQSAFSLVHLGFS